MDEAIRRWLERDPDPETRGELERLLAAGADVELADRFAGRLAFGTAGLRGTYGAGPNRINRLVVRETSAGLGRYLLATTPEAARRGVVIGYDGRRLSDVFARDAAATLIGLGVRVFLYDRCAPTPLCAYAVLARHAAGGVMVTASHNPPEYDGYKVYWGDGAQIIPPHDSGIAAAIERAASEEFPWCELDRAEREGLLTWLGQETIDAYLEGVRRLSVRPERTGREQLRVAYTAMHGVGAAVAEAALGAAGFAAVWSVAEQREPDGRFPTLRFPNPEEPGAMDRVIALARAHDAELACANDPDADRLAVAVRLPDGTYRQLNGDQIGALLGDELLASAPPDAAVGTSIVSSRMLGVIAAARGATAFTTLTGLKWIAAGAAKQTAAGKRFVFGYEEAIGFMIGELVRDKDGISALVAFCELAAALRARGISVWQRLGELYRQHGLYLTSLASIRLDPNHRGPPIGERLRAQAPTTIAGVAVTECVDLAAGVRRQGGREEPVDLPRSDVLLYTLADDARVIVRPSGTEPKVKCYYEVHETVGDETVETALRRAEAHLAALTRAHQTELQALQD